MYDIPAAISAVGNAVAGYYNWAKMKLGLMNTPEMQKAAEAQKLRDVNNQISKSTQTGSEDEAREDIAP